MDLKSEVALGKQNFTLFLGGMQPADLKSLVSSAKTMAEFGRQLGVTYVGYLVEYRLNEEEDLKIVSLLVKPSTEKRYDCQCMEDKRKLPLHVYHQPTAQTLTYLAGACHCNLNFTDYYK